MGSLVRAGLTALAFSLVACGSEQSVPPAAPWPAPSPTPAPGPPAPGSSITVSGTVFEYTAAGPRPLPNVSLLVHPYPLEQGFLKATSDAAGRYSVSGIRSGIAVSIAPELGSGYYAPCPNGSDTITSDRTIDVHVVSAAVVSTAGAPSTVPRLGSIWVSGTVMERTPNGMRPISGASVNLAGNDENDPRLGSNTLTDAMGRYLLCPAIPGTGTDTYAMIRVQRDGYQPALRAAFLGWDYDGIDVELVPK
jgi:hypothetical protein